jgi:hypothetical protein
MRPALGRICRHAAGQSRGALCFRAALFDDRRRPYFGHAVVLPGSSSFRPWMRAVGRITGKPSIMYLGKEHGQSGNNAGPLDGVDSDPGSRCHLIPWCDAQGVQQFLSEKVATKKLAWRSECKPFLVDPTPLYPQHGSDAGIHCRKSLNRLRGEDENEPLVRYQGVTFLGLNLIRKYLKRNGRGERI